MNKKSPKLNVTIGVQVEVRIASRSNVYDCLTMFAYIFYDPKL